MIGQKTIDNTQQTDVMTLDFSKAFYVVAHQRLLSKLSSCGIRGNVHTWVANFLIYCQRVVVNGEASEWVPVSSGLPQGTVLGPLLFLIYFNDITEGISSELRLFADDCLLYRVIKSTRDCELLQQDLDRLVRWSERWLKRFNMQKCTSMSVHQLRSRYQDYTYEMNDVALIRTTEQKYLVVTLTPDLRWSTLISSIASKTNRSLGLVKRLPAR